ncbi:unnamed protein product [Brassica napus]|uniref:(rape) hypothetical protein n=1 Tax=Brassica napus TaxID=3708 RepID=A0A816SQL0_BRANA|nr:unnamed protein product [Brassica napus]
MCKCRSHGTFPLFGLQSSHLNICYYHQDLHLTSLRPGSRPRFCSDRRPPTIEAGSCPDGRRAQLGTVNPASGSSRIASSAYQNGPLGALDSVGWLNKAATRPTYLKFENRSRTLRMLTLNPSQKIKVGRCAPVRDPANQLPCPSRGLLTR